MLDISGVSFAYKGLQPALKHVSLSVRPGEFVAIVGRNGSGKTTLTRLIMSLIKPTAGHILLHGRDTRTATPADMARHIGYVFQNPDRQLVRDTVAAEVAYGPEQLGFEPARMQAAVAEALATTGLTACADAYPRLLSKGHRQRVAIASALAMQPEILILDEPTSGQDRLERDRLLQLLGDLHRQKKTILLVTHDMDILASHAQRAFVLADGEKVFDGDVKDLLTEKRMMERWGLDQPAALKMSQGLARFGIQPALTVEALADQLFEAGKTTGGGVCG